MPRNPRPDQIGMGGRIIPEYARVRVEHEKRVRAWFFQQDNGYYVQCRYGSRVLNINGKSNAVFVDKLEAVAGVLEAFKLAADTGELDKAVAIVTKARSS